jgi:branched-chain amino acid transport system ATP-binding protein
VTALLEATGISAGYGPAAVLHDIALTVAEGSITAVIGSNGAGKTTLMRVLAGLLAPGAGRLGFAGQDITGLSTSERVARGLVLVPEGRLVFPDLTVEETLRIGAYARHARAGAAARAGAMYQLFPRLAERRAARAGSLSGGEQQMLALARGLMAVPRLLLLDEPSLGLAPALAERVFAAIQTIRERGTTILLVEQDVQSTLALADQAYVLENGAITGEGSGASLLESPLVRESYLGL